MNEGGVKLSLIRVKEKHSVILFNQESWLKEYIDMNDELRQ